MSSNSAETPKTEVQKAGVIVAYTDESGEKIRIANVNEGGMDAPFVEVPANKPFSISFDGSGKMEILVNGAPAPAGYFDNSVTDALKTNITKDNCSNINTALMNLETSIKNKLKKASTYSEPAVDASAVPVGSVAAQMTKNVGIYGNGISQLMWPDDITDYSVHNGMYTAFFISEHQDASISKSNNLATGSQRVGQRKAGWVTDSLKNTNGKDVEETITNVTDGAFSTVAGFAAMKAITKAFPTLGTGSASLLQSGWGAAFKAGIAVAAGGLTYHTVQNYSDLKIKTNYAQLKSCIILPTPQISSSSSIEWKENNTDRATIASAIVHMAGNGNFVPMMDNSQSKMTFDQSRNEIISAAKLKYGDTLSGNLYSKMTGKTINSRKEQLFSDVQFRTYDFKYTMFARSKSELENIQSIIKVFKYHAHPELSPSTFMYTYPAQFDIVHYFKDKQNPNLPRHATSVLTNIDVEYGEGDFMSVTRDGAPLIVNMTLKFLELAVLNRADMMNGY